MLPAFDPPFLSSRAVRFDRARRARVGPVASQRHLILDAVEPPGQPFPGWAAIHIFLGQVDKVLLAKPAFRLGT